jgi:1,2-diacylglycerol 3-beta-galactosyltransferase
LVKRVLFLMSDTGGGHRAAAEAIRDGLYIKYGQENLRVELVDVFKQSPFPLNFMPEFYPWIVNHSKASWEFGYNLSNTRRRADVISQGVYLTSGAKLRQMVRHNQADVVVCVHSVIARPSMAAFRTLPERPPFLTVVTDLVSTHMFWYDRRVERCLVPTKEAFERGIECGLTPEQMRITGLPVHPRFSLASQDRDEARQQLGWDPRLPAVMVMAGGEGMGPLFEMTRAINDQRLNCQLVIVAGKNKALKARLEAVQWNQPTHIYGFVTDVPRLMVAADILVTKAGPATISEACIAGLPMILSDAIPGQETGNIDFVIENNAGVFAPSPYSVAATVRDWLKEGESGLRRRAENARRLARPNAVWEIAEEVWEHAHKPPIRRERRRLLHELIKAQQFDSFRILN